MEQTKALNALEPFLALTKSASSPASAASLIQKATSAPNTYIFHPLISAPQILTLRESPDHAGSFRLLEIFSYGTYTDYTSSSTPLPTLNDAQTVKLRQLSLLSLAADPRNLTYASLITTLGLSSTKELEDLVISSIYAGLLTATLDPSHSTVLVASVSPLRDVAPSSIPTMIATLKEWSNRCDETLLGLEEQIKAIRFEAARRAKEEAEWNQKVQAMLEKSAEAGKNKSGGLAGGEDSGNATGYSGNSGTMSGFGSKLGRVLGRRGDGNLQQKRGFSGGSEDESMDVDDEEEDDGGRGSVGKAKKKGFGFGH